MFMERCKAGTCHHRLQGYDVWHKVRVHAAAAPTFSFTTSSTRLAVSSPALAMIWLVDKEMKKGEGVCVWPCRTLAAAHDLRKAPCTPRG